MNKLPLHPMILEALDKRYTYDPDTGIIYRDGKPNPFYHKNDYAITNVRTIDPMYLKMECKLYVHCVAWYLAYGVWAVNKEIDHIDGDPLNNKLNNLRLATHTENMRNVGKKSAATTHSSKYKGVHYNKRHKKWIARITINGGIRKELGKYLSEEDAAHAYDVACKELHGEFAYLNFPAFDYDNWTPTTKCVREKSSQYVGVYYHKKKGKWIARIYLQGKKKHLGAFSIQEDAARAYDAAALLYRGNTAKLNFPT